MPQITADQDASPRVAPPQEVGARRFRTFRVIGALILRETGSRESSSSLGFLWTVIDPILTTILLSAIFSLLMRQPRLGTNFELYYITGVGPFHLYSQVQNRVAGSIRFSRSLLGFPAVTVIDAIMARFLLNVFVNLVVFLALIEGILHYYQLRDVPDIPNVLLGLAMAAALGLGIGTLNAVLFLASPTYESVWGIINRPMALASGVMFLVSDLPDYIFKYLWWNPLVHVIGEMRHAFFPSYDAGYVSPAYVFMVAAVCFTLGLVGLHRYVFDALER